MADIAKVSGAQVAAGAWIDGVQSAEFKTLIDTKRRSIVPMIVIYVVGYIGLTALAGFAKDLMALKVIGALNVGFFLIACNYVLSLIIALAYVRVANGILDPMVRRLVSASFGEGAPR